MILVAAILAATAPFLDEAELKRQYDATSVYAIYNTKSADEYTNTQNPLAAVMGVCKHYGKLPPAAAKMQKDKQGGDKEWIRVLNKLVKSAGLRDANFGQLNKWKTNFSRHFKLKDAKKDLVEVENELTFRSEAKRIEAWLSEKSPVLWVREATGDEQDDDNKRINGGKPFPLTIALIDGVDDEGRYHVVWPRGNDRRYKNVKNGWYKPQDLFYDVKRSILIYWRP